MRTRIATSGFPVSTFSVLFLAAALLAAGFTTLAPASSEQPAFCRVSDADRIPAGMSGQSRAGIALAASARKVSRNRPVYARFVNRGEARATYGPAFRIEHWVGSRWLLDPASPMGPWHKVLWLLKAGSAGRCYSFVVPEDLAAGRYRFASSVTINGDRSRRTVSFTVNSSLPRAPIHRSRTWIVSRKLKPMGIER